MISRTLISQEETESAEMLMVVSILLILISQLVQMIQDLNTFRRELEISMHAKRYASMIENVQLSTSTYSIQDTTTTAGSGQKLVIHQMVQPKLTALSRMQVPDQFQHLKIHLIKSGMVTIMICHTTTSTMMDMTINMAQELILITITMYKNLLTNLSSCVTDTPKLMDVLVEATSRDGRIKLKLNVNKSVTEPWDVKDLSYSKPVVKDQ